MTIINSVNLEQQQKNALFFLLDYLKQENYGFTTITPLSHQRIIDRKNNLNNPSIDLKDIFGWNLAFKKDDLPPELFANLDAANLIAPNDDGKWLSRVRVATLADELFIHSAFPTCDQDSVFFGPDTYRFIYHLKAFLLNRKTPLNRVVELCCGASPAAITVGKLFPDIPEVFAVDINPKALFYSAINATFAGLQHLHPVSSNLFNQLQGQFDLILANPPYLMDVQQRQYRHGGNDLDGAQLSFDIIKKGIEKLTRNGSLFLYTGIAVSKHANRFLEALEDLMSSHSGYEWSYEEIDPDVFGEELEQPCYQHIERIAAVVVKITRT